MTPAEAALFMAYVSWMQKLKSAAFRNVRAWRNPPKPKPCAWCGKIYQPSESPRAKYCEPACAKAAWEARKMDIRLQRSIEKLHRKQQQNLVIALAKTTKGTRKKKAR